MSSTPKRFTRYDAEHHDPATEYVLAEEHDARVRELEAFLHYGVGRLTELRNERNELARLRDRLVTELEAANQQLSALSYPVYLHTNPVLTVESGGIRYVLEAFSDEDGGWFEVKSATPTEAMDLETFTVLPMRVSATCRYTAVTEKAREALRQWREEHQRDADEARGV